MATAFADGIGDALSSADAPAAGAALAKYGKPQFLQRTFADYNQPGGWTDTLDDSVPSQRPAISRARAIVPQMLALTFDVAKDLGDAGDGTIAQEAQAVAEGAMAAGQIYEGNFAAGAVDAYSAVSDWMGANTAEWARINNEKIAIDVAKQILANIVSGVASSTHSTGSLFQSVLSKGLGLVMQPTLAKSALGDRPTELNIRKGLSGATLATFGAQVSPMATFGAAGKATPPAGKSSGKTVAIVVGGVAGAAALGTLVFFLTRKRRRRGR